jgi:hypothetical protein
MSNITTTAGGLPAGLAGLVTGLRETAQEFARSGSSVPLLKLAKSGEWTVGKDEDVVENGTQAVVNVLGIERGYVCWGKGADEGQLLGNEMRPLSRPAPDPDKLPALNGDWEKVIAIPMSLLLDGGRVYPVIYNAKSKGAKDAGESLLMAVADQASAGKPYVPVVALQTDSYKHAKYGRIYKPVLQIVRWMTVEQALGQAEAQEPEPGAEPAGSAATSGHEGVATSSSRRRRL